MISIIIVSWQVEKLLEKCLTSIYQYEKTVPFEIIVVDNNSRDQTVTMVREKFPEVKLITLAENFGFAKAANLGAKESQGDYLLFLNPDTEWQEEIFPKIIKFYQSHEKIGALGVRLLNPNLTVQHWIRKLPSLFSQIIILSKLPVLSKKIIKKYLCLYFDYQKNAVVEQVIGAFFFINREIFNQQGGFDEHFFIWFEEVDLCFRLQQAGFINYYLANCSIIHYGEKSFAQLDNFKKQQLFNRSLIYFFKKNHSFIEYFLLLLMLPLNIFLTLIIIFLKFKPKHYL